MSFNFKKLNWQETDPTNFDGYSIDSPAVIVYNDGRVQIVGDVNKFGGTCGCCRNGVFEGIKMWAKLEVGE